LDVGFPTQSGGWLTIPIDAEPERVDIIAHHPGYIWASGYCATKTI
jgi:hypothetical protein